MFKRTLTRERRVLFNEKTGKCPKCGGANIAVIAHNALDRNSSFVIRHFFAVEILHYVQNDKRGTAFRSYRMKVFERGAGETFYKKVSPANHPAAYGGIPPREWNFSAVGDFSTTLEMTGLFAQYSLSDLPTSYLTFYLLHYKVKCYDKK
ncbi:MAG: hypothetical protein LBL66_06665 [Clostridiales bacterium]|nr:hypothetical protein [Clostridiales bacterium]